MTAQAASSDTMPLQRPRRRWRRMALMVALPVALAVGGGYAWATGGRYISTENAAVQQDRITLAAEVTGRIVEVAVRENQTVRPGEVLFRIDPEPYRLALHQAEAEIASARLKVEQLRSAYQESLAERRASEQNLEFAQREYDRQATLNKGGYATQAKFDEARHDLQAAEQRLEKAKQGVASALAALGGDPGIATDQHPLLLEALARKEKAALDLEHATVRAPAAGIVSQTDRLQVGQYVPAGTPALSLVETQNSWIEANFKETDLTYMAVGQPATVELDAYPGRVLTAEVDSIGAGTGATFSLLPPENATGNWVKVVQRVPVRLKLDTPLPDVPLRAGLSADVSVDTGHVRGLPSPIRSALALTGLEPSGNGEAAGR